MTILKSVRRDFATLGINLNQPASRRPFNARNTSVILVFGSSLISSYVRVFQSHTFKEYIDSIHIGLALTLASAMLGIVMYKMDKMSEIFQSIEKILVDSEWKCHEVQSIFQN